MSQINAAAGPKDRPVPFASNEVRLSPRQCLAALVLLAAAFLLIPILWRQVEPLEVGADYRMPYRLGHDYWAYERYCGEACRRGGILVIGDSVVWGHYVAKDETLSQNLDELDTASSYMNLGVDGIHPVAMAGLVRNYAGDVVDQDVILHCNLLWTSSPRHDLQIEKEFSLNHPDLIPQFLPRIPCYRQSLSNKLGILVGHEVSMLGWAAHLRIAYFDDTSLPAWTVEHPYRNPLRAVTLRLPSPDEPPSPKPDARPWTEKGIGQFNAPWVGLETSLQWRFLQSAVDLLQERGNRLFVLVGPLNEHMLTPQSLAIYRRRKQAVTAWLTERRIAHFVPDALPSEHYADASHPLAEGYALLAERLFADESFAHFRLGQPAASRGR